jgi:hypothetical protein
MPAALVILPVRFSPSATVILAQAADPQPNSAYHLGTYVPFLDSTQPPIHRND